VGIRRKYALAFAITIALFFLPSEPPRGRADDEAVVFFDSGVLDTVDSPGHSPGV